MILGVYCVAINTGNLQRLRNFYVDLMGFRVVFENHWEGNPKSDESLGLEDSAAESVNLSTGNIQLKIHEFSWPPPRSEETPRVFDRGYTLLTLHVTDLPAEYERLAAAGMEFVSPPADYLYMEEGRPSPNPAVACFGYDPDGNLIELAEIKSGGFDPEGKRV
jgi:catechol 2,3-dioxygenase-like lactoylglutathione lyase family enzyme